MKTKILLYTLLMAVVAAFSSCSSDLSEEYAGQNGKQPLLTIGSVQVSDINGTRASKKSTTFEKGDTIGLYVLNSNFDMYSDARDSCIDVPAVFDGTSWKIQNNIQLTHGDALVFAFYPYTKTDFGSKITAPWIVPIDGLVKGASGQSDVMMSYTSVSSDNPTANLSFTHLLSRVVFSIKVSKDFGAANLTKATLALRNSTNPYRDKRLTTWFAVTLEGPTMADFQARLNSELVGGNPYSNYVSSLTIPCSASLSSDKSYDVEFLVPNQYDITDSLYTLSLSISGHNYILPVPSSSRWSLGYTYTYPVTINNRIGAGGIIDNHEYVDLGLPSGTLWAKMNIGASASEQIGDKFAWGEITTKASYNWSNYKYCNGKQNVFTKYNSETKNGYNGFVDNKNELDPEDDAAHVKWGGDWQMPTREDVYELRFNCTWTEVRQNGIRGFKVTGANGNSIFLPTVSYFVMSNDRNTDGYKFGWTKSLSGEQAYTLYYYPKDGRNVSGCSSYRSDGYPIRPVMHK